MISGKLHDILVCFKEKSMSFSNEIFNASSYNYEYAFLFWNEIV